VETFWGIERGRARVVEVGGFGHDLPGAGEDEGLFDGRELGEEGAEEGFFGSKVGCSGLRGGSGSVCD
jgi:hypothetical protein